MQAHTRPLTCQTIVKRSVLIRPALPLRTNQFHIQKYLFVSNHASIALNDGDLPGSGSGSVNITPEPPGILLLGTACLMAGGLIYRRRSTEQATQA